MTSSPEKNLITSLKRLDDHDAARLVSEQAFSELLEGVLAARPVPRSAPYAHKTMRRGLRRPLLALTAIAATSAVVMGVTGAFSGSVPTEVQPANAAVIRGAITALADPPGSIVIETTNGIQHTNRRQVPHTPGSPEPKGIETDRFAQSRIIEIAGRGAPQNMVTLVEPGLRDGVEVGELNGNNELYDPATNTVYVDSAYSANITAGPKPGTFTYRWPTQTDAPAGTAATESNTDPPVTLTITAAQRAALIDGRSQIEGFFGTQAHSLKIVPALRTTSDTDEIRSRLKAGTLTVAGPITIDGRRAIKLVGRHGTSSTEYDIDPGTYAPLREILHTRGVLVTTNWSEYRVLAATPANQQLLNLAYRHPNARIDRSHADYLAAQARLLEVR
jgi:hypothetical protein